MNIKDIKLGDRFEYKGIIVEAAINPEVLLLGERKCWFCEFNTVEYSCREFIDFILKSKLRRRGNYCRDFGYFFKRIDDD